MTHNYSSHSMQHAGKLKTVLIGEKYTSYINALEKLGINVIKVPRNQDIDERIAFHADMSFFQAKTNEYFITESNPKLCIIMHGLGAIIHRCEKCGIYYPNDVKTNCCIIGNHLFYNAKGTSAAIIEYAEKNRIKTVKVNQGYIKCSVCILDDKHIATEDNSIADAAEENGISVLRLKDEGIILEGFDKGFIGGASGKISSHELVLTGRLKNDSLERYAESIGIRIIYLSDEPAHDIGSIIPLQ